MTDQPDERPDPRKLLEVSIALVAAEDDVVPMDWVLVTAAHGMADGDTFTVLSWEAGDDQPHYRTLGLLDYARDRLRDRLAGPSERELGGDEE